MIPQNEFFIATWDESRTDNSNFNFSQLCDDVSFAGSPVSVIPRAPIWLSTFLIRTYTRLSSLAYFLDLLFLINCIVFLLRVVGLHFDMP